MGAYPVESPGFLALTTSSEGNDVTDTPHSTSESPTPSIQSPAPVSESSLAPEPNIKAAEKGATEDTEDTEPTVTVSIVSYNGMKTIARCLDSILQQTYQNITVIVVNNASTDGTPTWIAEHYPHVKVLNHPENRGPNPARNVGITQAESDLVLLLDDDAFLAKDCLAELVKAYQTHPEASVWIPRLVYSDQPDLIQHEGVHIHYISEAILVNGDVPLHEGLQEPITVSAVSGTCLLVRKSAALSIGLFDEDYFFGRTDGEFSFRLTLAGHHLCSIPQAVVLHRVKTRGLSKVFYQVRNRWYFTLTTFSWRTLILSIPAFLVYEVSLAAFLCMKGAAKDYLRAMGAVIQDLPKILSKRREFQPKKVISDRQILRSDPLNMRSDLLTNRPVAYLKASLDSFFKLYWKLIYPLI